MKKWVLFFATKNESCPTPFRKIRIQRHDRGDKAAFVTIIESETKERAWDSVFTCCPDYVSLGQQLLDGFTKVRNPERPDELILPSLEQIAKSC